MTKKHTDNNLSPYFGEYGGQYVAETLIEPLRELTEGFKKVCQDKDFVDEMAMIASRFCGRPTPVSYAANLSEFLQGARIYLKREDLLHTGAHKINNAVGQALLAKKMGKSRIIAETGAGQHGVATATACALLKLKCEIYMGAVDAKRQAPNLQRMRLLGAKVHLVEQGSQTLKDAINEAIRDWIANIDNTHYLIGSAIGPHPFPSIVRYFQSVISDEAKRQMLEHYNCLPSVVVACVGGGSNAIGMFANFLDDTQVKLIGVQAGGANGKHSAPLLFGEPGVLHGCKTTVLQNEDGQILETHSLAPGLDYPAVGPEHSYLKKMGRVEYVTATDEQALSAFQMLSRYEGIIPALESAHAISYAIEKASQLSKKESILVNVSGRGDKDLAQVMEIISSKLRNS